MKKYLNYLLAVVVVFAFVGFVYSIFTLSEREVKRNPYRLRAGGNYWHIKSIDSVVGDKTYFTNKNNEVIFVKGPYVLEKR